MLSIGKWQISTPQGAKTPKLILMKPFTVDYVQVVGILVPSDFIALPNPMQKGVTKITSVARPNKAATTLIEA